MLNILASLYVCTITLSTMLQFTVPSYMMLDDLASWDLIGNYMKNTNAKRILLNWSGLGGYTWVGQRFINDIGTAQRQGKKIELNVIGPAISMHALVACYADSYKIQPDGMLIFHAEFIGGTEGHKIYLNDRYYFNQCVVKHILTKEEVNAIVIRHKQIIITEDGKHKIKKDWP